MFLFTTPKANEASRSPAAGGPVVQAIRQGADKTGTGFDYLLRTAQRESALDPQAKASTSSATGLFQFIEQTWLGMVKQEGPRHGLGAYAEAIKDGEGGRLNVADPKTRQDILDLRRDPQLAAVMAGALTSKNREALAGTLGRQPTQGELYIAHVMGARGATDMIKGATDTPQGAAATAFPEAAAANRNIFFDKSGKARPFSDVYAMLSASHVSSTASVAWPGVSKAKGIIGLFSTEGARGPVSEAVTKYWATPRNNGARVAMIENGPRFFPRDGADVTASTDSVASAATVQSVQPALVQAPLPPIRPSNMAGAAVPSSNMPSSIAPNPAMRVSSQPVAEGAKQRQPLDLSRFLKGRDRS
jgi:hypothetical protein